MVSPSLKVGKDMGVQFADGAGERSVQALATMPVHPMCEQLA